MGMTIVEKILAKASDRDSVCVGDVVEPKVDLAMSHENAALIINRFKTIYEGTGLEANVWDTSKIAIIFDHRVPAVDRKTATDQGTIRKFVGDQGIEKFHDIRGDTGGICHQILAEYGYVHPGRVVVGTDSHTTTHGAFGAFAYGIGATEMACVWTLGKALNVKVPKTIKVVITGKFHSLVSPKDLILHIIRKLTVKGANFSVLEFHGEVIRNMNMSGRLTICNMAVEAGATAGIVMTDNVTIEHLREAGYEGDIDIVHPDEDAAYSKILEVDVSELSPQIACPHMVDNVEDIEDVKGIAVNQVVIGSCTNGRLEDIAIAAKILQFEKVSKNVRLLIFPASAKVYKEASMHGYINDLIDAGAVIMNPGCGCCLGVHQGALGDGEVALSTTNRNFKGRMGNSDAKVYLCSPAVAAFSAISGKISWEK